MLGVKFSTFSTWEELMTYLQEVMVKFIRGAVVAPNGKYYVLLLDIFSIEYACQLRTFMHFYVSKGDLGCCIVDGCIEPACLEEDCFAKGG